MEEVSLKWDGYGKVNILTKVAARETSALVGNCKVACMGFKHKILC